MKVSGTQAILAHLKRGRSISGIQALNRFGAYRLSDVIFKLRSRGWPIVTEMKRSGTKEYAVYRMGSGAKPNLILPV